MWEAVALTVAAAAGNNIGKVLQKQGTKGLPQLSLDLKVIKRYGTSRTWVTGVAVDVAGAILMLKAVSQAPVSIVQPVSGCGLAVLAVFSHFYLHEAMHGLDWVGVAMAAMGTVAVGATGEGQKKGHISVIRLLLFFSWLALFFALLNWWARSGKRRHQKYEPLESQLVLSRDVDVIEEIASGMEAGACFGLSATVCKMGFIMAESGMSSWFVPAGIAAGICCSASGFFCQRYGDQVRAVWVTRYDFHTDSDVMRIMHQSAQAGFNTVFFQVRGNASTYFSSKIEPWSECYDWKSPGFDPLRLAIKEAHSQNMALHAWINVMPMWRGMSPPSNPDHMYVRHPQWSWFDAHGTRQPLNTGFYVSANPCLPEVRKHIMGICQEIVADYEVDGLHLDYIRFPNEHPVLHGHQYPRDQRTLELFKEATGLGPEDKPSVWDQWRCDCVTALLRDIRRTAKSLRPQLVLSAAVAVDRKEALSRFQDVEQWVKERLLDAVVPMNYTICHKTFRLRVERDWAIEVDRSSSGLCTKKLPLRKRPQHPKGNRMAPEQFVKEAIVEDWAPLPAPAVIMGTSVESGDCHLHQKQLALALQRFGHFSVFCYSSLFSPTSRAGKGNNSNDNNNRQTSLLSFLKVLSDASKLFTSLDHSTNSTRNLQQQHPFRAFDLRAHPEEALQFDDRVDFRAPLALPPVAKVLDFQPYPDHHDIQKFGRRRKKPGGRYVISITGEIVKLNRRTFRKSLAAKLEKKECFLDAAVKERGKLNIISAQAQQQQQCTSVASSFSSPSSTTKQPAKLGPYVAMDNWEAVKMLEATASEKKKMAEPLTDCKHGGDLQPSDHESYSSKSAVFFVPSKKKPKVIRLTSCR